MSWEDSDPVWHPCPCGRARYSIIHRSDDWGRSDERWEMHCPSCRESHGLYVSQHNRKGIHVEQYRWVRREVLDQIAEIEQRIQRAKGSLDSYLSATYSLRLLAWLTGKTKKAIWQQLVADGRDYPSLATFYTHVRQDGLEKSMRRYLRYDEVKTLERILELNDEHLDRAIVDLARFEAQAQEAHALTR